MDFGETLSLLLLPVENSNSPSLSSLHQVFGRIASSIVDPVPEFSMEQLAYCVMCMSCKLNGSDIHVFQESSTSSLPAGLPLHTPL